MVIDVSVLIGGLKAVLILVEEKMAETRQQVPFSNRSRLYFVDQYHT